jgi:uncharacterized protein YjbI with pentapeptide repeats
MNVIFDKNGNQIYSTSSSLIGHDFSDKDLSGAVFANLNLEGANFEYSNLSGASFENAELYWANFFHADLQDADFTGADIRGGDFKHAKLNNAKFVSASIGKDNVGGLTYFDNAILCGVEFSETNLEFCSLCDVVYDDSTIFPKHFTAKDRLNQKP